jgi:hypothetical protein
VLGARYVNAGSLIIVVAHPRGGPTADEMR